MSLQPQEVPQFPTRHAVSHERPSPRATSTSACVTPSAPSIMTGSVSSRATEVRRNC
jgi:hypothetical protein